MIPQPTPQQSTYKCVTFASFSQSPQLLLPISSLPMHNGLLDLEPDMPDHSGFDPRNIFNVEGMVVVITGGGTGSICRPSIVSSLLRLFQVLAS